MVRLQGVQFRRCPAFCTTIRLLEPSSTTRTHIHCQPDPFTVRSYPIKISIAGFGTPSLCWKSGEARIIMVQTGQE